MSTCPSQLGVVAVVLGAGFIGKGLSIINSAGPGKG